MRDAVARPRTNRAVPVAARAFGAVPGTWGTCAVLCFRGVWPADLSALRVAAKPLPVDGGALIHDTAGFGPCRDGLGAEGQPAAPAAPAARNIAVQRGVLRRRAADVAVGRAVPRRPVPAFALPHDPGGAIRPKPVLPILAALAVRIATLSGRHFTQGRRRT